LCIPRDGVRETTVKKSNEEERQQAAVAVTDKGGEKGGESVVGLDFYSFLLEHVERQSRRSSIILPIFQYGKEWSLGNGRGSLMGRCVHNGNGDYDDALHYLCCIFILREQWRGAILLPPQVRMLLEKFGTGVWESNHIPIFLTPRSVLYGSTRADFLPTERHFSHQKHADALTLTTPLLQVRGHEGTFVLHNYFFSQQIQYSFLGV